MIAQTFDSQYLAAGAVFSAQYLDPVNVAPAAAVLTLTAPAITLHLSDHHPVVPAQAAISTSASAPQTARTDHHFVATGLSGATLVGSAPDALGTAHQWVNPAATAMAIITTASAVLHTHHVLTAPAVVGIFTTGSTPVIGQSFHHRVTAPSASVITAPTIPAVLTTAHRTVTPASVALAITTAIPAVAQAQNLQVNPANANAVLGGTAPQVGMSHHVAVSPPVGAANASGKVPSVTASQAGVQVVPFGPGETYANLEAAIIGTAPLDLVTGNISELVFQATSAFEDNNTQPTISSGDFTTDNSHRVVIRPTILAQHNGVAGSGYRLTANGYNSAFDNPLLYFSGAINWTVEGVEIVGGGEIGVGKQVVLLYASGFGNNGVINRCMVHNTSASIENGGGSGISKWGLSEMVIANSVIYACAGIGVGSDSGLAGQMKLVNCTVANNGDNGIQSGTSDNQITLVNSIVSGNGTSDIPLNTLSTTGNDWVVTSDASAVGSNIIPNFSPSYTNPASGDFHLVTADNATIRTFWPSSPTQVQIDTLVSTWPLYGGQWSANLDVGLATRNEPLTPGAVALAPAPEIVVPFGPGETYTSLSAALNAKAAGQPGAIDPVTDNVHLIFEATSAFADAPVFISEIDYRTDASHPITIRTTAGARHNGTPGSGYRITASGNTTAGAILLNVWVSHVNFQGIEVDGRGSTGGGYVITCVSTDDLLADGAPSQISIDGCLIHSSDGNGIAPMTGVGITSNITIANSVISDNTGAGLLMPDVGTASTVVRMVGCTLAYNWLAIDTAGTIGAVEMIGCLSANNTTGVSSSLFNAASDWNTFTGAYAPGANSQTSAVIAFTDATGGDYSLTTADYAALTAKPSAATVDAAVAAWPGDFNTSWDVTASPRVDPRTPGAYLPGKTEALPLSATITTVTNAPTTLRSQHIWADPIVVAANIITTLPGVAQTRHHGIAPQVSSLGLSGQMPAVAASAHRRVTPPYLGLQTSVTAPLVGHTWHRYTTPGVSTLASVAAAPLVTRTGHHLRRPLVRGLTIHPSIPNFTRTGTSAPTAQRRLLARAEQHTTQVSAETHGVIVAPETQSVSI